MGGVSLNPSAVPGASLTAREGEVLDLMVAGFTTREIQGLMCISNPTFHQYIGQAKIKLEARTTHQLVAIHARNST